MAGTYSLKNAMRDFTVEELAEGLEGVLSKDLSIRLQEKPGDTVISMELKNDSSAWGQISTEVRMDEEEGDLLKVSCSCGSFRSDGYTCRHITNAVTAYLVKKEGVEAFQGTALEKALIRRTRIDTPLLPGILRHTDDSVKAILSSSSAGKNRSKPVWVTNPLELPALRLEEAGGQKAVIKKSRQSDLLPLTVECKLQPRNGRITVELKVGPKRRYVIRHMDLLLKAYCSNQSYQFTGSTELGAGRDCYLESDRVLMDFLAAIYTNAQRSDSSCFVRTAYNYNDIREMFLSGRDIDAFMDMYDERTIELDGDGGSSDCRIALSDEIVPGSLTRENYGVIFAMPPVRLVGCGLEWMYLEQGRKILRLPAEQWENYKKLSTMTSGREKVYVSNQDLQAFCQLLREMDMDQTLITEESLDIAEYLPEMPRIRIYLDYPQEYWISCRVTAWYESKKKEYSIFDTKKGRAVRNFSVEQSAGEVVWRYFTSFDENAGELFLNCDDDMLYDFLVVTIPLLANTGEVLISDQLKKFRVRKAGDINVGVQVEAGSLVMSLQSNTMAKDEMIELLSAYRSKRRFTRLKNGEFIVMDSKTEEVWETLAETFRNYGSKDPEAMKIPMYRALYLEESLRNRDEICFSESEEYLELLDHVRNEETRNYQVPDTLADVLRPYQVSGYRWLRMLKNNGFGGILADDMGLGKTIQVLAFLLVEKELAEERWAENAELTGNVLSEAGISEKAEDRNPRTLVVAPASLIYNWKRELEHFTPQLKCRVIAGTTKERKLIIHQIGKEEPEVYITSYDLLKRDIKEYEGIHFEHQIIDEAQFIKNQSTQAAKCVRLIDSSFRVALTGTPIENRLSDLWSIFDYLMPGFLYSYNRFRDEYESPVVREQDEWTMNRLRRMVHPFILRRLKKDVLADLPDKLEETVSVCLEGEQRKIYDAYAERLRLYLDKQSDEEFHQSKLEVLAELTKLRQICCGPEVFLEGYRGPDSKKEAALELIRQAIDGGHKVLLFSQFTRVLDELGEALKRSKIAYHRLDGSTSKEKRMELVTSFETDQVPVFCISLKAGGTGLNLTAADIVIHYDPWWNIAAQNQATDRAHRIGQTSTVTVYQLIAEKTIEEQIMNLQKAKAQLAEDILTGESISSILVDKENLMELLC